MHLVCCLHGKSTVRTIVERIEQAGMPGKADKRIMEKIYIIEDDENIRNLLKIALEGFGYGSEGFETAEEGLKRMKEEQPDLAIFDWMLPGMDGIAAIKQVRQTDGLKDIPIMLLTAKEKELDKVIGLDCPSGCWNFPPGSAACCAGPGGRRPGMSCLIRGYR